MSNFCFSALDGYTWVVPTQALDELDLYLDLDAM
jgi:hypothetical protein